MAQRVDPNSWRGTVGRRVRLVVVAFFVWALAIETSLFYWQVFAHERMKAEAADQQLRMVDVPAPRGEILDRHGKVLAYSVDVDSIGAVPSLAGDPEAAVRLLCGALNCDGDQRQRLLDRFRNPKRKSWAVVRSKASPDEARRVRALQLPWVVFHKEPRRFYPNLSLAAHVLGYVGTEDVGLGGLELKYNELLRGRGGKLLVQQASGGHVLSSTVGAPPVPGARLELTIDHHLQYVAERELRAGVAEYGAQGGMVVIMEPHTGELLAIANEPTFNPNVYLQSTPIEWRNRAVQDTYEP
ncbi:MAG TPA: penicillin-binding transpeptidase domain-containing protein, partial [Vicinamibacterales bacterium]|nr:penicillin-binding transpeptidase domain-containing protein [Vicinamibacterales bacterium]